MSIFDSDVVQLQKLFSLHPEDQARRMLDALVGADSEASVLLPPPCFDAPSFVASHGSHLLVWVQGAAERIQMQDSVQAVVDAHANWFGANGAANAECAKPAYDCESGSAGK